LTEKFFPNISLLNQQLPEIFGNWDTLVTGTENNCSVYCRNIWTHHSTFSCISSITCWQDEITNNKFKELLVGTSLGLLTSSSNIPINQIGRYI
jgi:hypothetical protein